VIGWFVGNDSHMPCSMEMREMFAGRRLGGAEEENVDCSIGEDWRSKPRLTYGVSMFRTMTFATCGTRWAA